MNILIVLGLFTGVFYAPGAMKRLDIVVVGAGIAGLACAAYLANHHRVAVVVEKLPKVGGRLPDGDGITPQYVNDFLELNPSKLNISKYSNPITFLRDFIEANHGEIILETTVKSLSYNKNIDIWDVRTSYGNISTRKAVLAIPMTETYTLLRPIFGRENWFKSYFTDPNANQNVLLAKMSYHGLYLSGDYLFSSGQGSTHDALYSARYTAKKLIGLDT
jgi:thioredoxin reductase